MKVLWFTNIPIDYCSNSVKIGGWMYGLRDELLRNTNIQIAAASFGEALNKYKPGSAYKYYRVAMPNGFIGKVRRRFLYNAAEEGHLRSYLRIINDVKPDIIHVFGTENPFGLVANYTKVPVVIHIQSVLKAYVNAYFPPGCSIFTHANWNPIRIISNYNKFQQFKIAAEREARIFSYCHNYMGRNKWDKSCLQLLSRQHKYYHVDEILRSGFYRQSNKVSRSISPQLSIASILSDHPYKGIDLVLKTARTLKDYTQIQFKWKVFGNIGLGRAEIDKASFHGIEFCGAINEKALIEELERSDLYVHPSYIEGSNNSVCEAQILGVTVLACNVGGIPDLIENQVTGVLVPANDPLAMAYNIKCLYENRLVLETLGRNAQKVAQMRHDKGSVVRQLIETYNDIISKNPR